MKKLDEYLADEISKFKDVLNEKKIVVFGIGTHISRLYKLWDFSNHVLCYVDNNSSLWGNEFMGKKIISPSEINNIKYNKFVICITSPHRCEIIKQLKKINNKLDVVDLYQLLDLQEWLNLHIDFSEKYLDFINRNKYQIRSYLNKDPVINVKKDNLVGIVIVPSFPGTWCYYSITIMLMLLCRGYHVKLIFDDLQSVGEYTLYEGMTEIFNEITNDVIRYINDSGINFETLYLSESKKSNINEREVTEVKNITRISALWQTSFKGFKTRGLDKNTIVNNIEPYLIENMKYVKGFFEDNNFDTINIYTGLYYNTGLYSVIAKEKNIRMSSYDSSGSKDGKVFFSSNGIFGQLPEIRAIIANGLISRDSTLLNKICNYSKDRIMKSQRETRDNDYDNYQIVVEDKFDTNIDVFIPLNIEWDSTASAVPCIFKDTEEWIIETISFILAKSSASIMVREHPGKNIFSKKYNFEKYNEIIETHFSNNPRVVFVSATDKVNTYKQVKKSKVVLPYSSTIGIEAAILGKKVVMCTDSYYSDIDIIKKGKSKRDYFKQILYILNSDNNESFAECELIDLYIALALHDYLGDNTYFSECFIDWTSKSFIELFELKLCNKIINTIAEGQYFCYQNISEEL